MRKLLISLVSVAILLLASVSSNAYAFELKDFKNQQMKTLNLEDFINESEPNDEFSSATPFTLDESYGGKISNGDVDFYKVEISKKGYFLISGQVNDVTSYIVPTIYDKDGNVVSDGSLTEDTMFFDSAFISEPGTYYVELIADPAIENEQEYLFLGVFLPGDVNRLSGSDRYETAVEIAEDGWGTIATEIILTTGQNFPDALAAGPLAYQLDAPILLTTKNQLPTSVINYISKSDVTKVTIIGGTDVVSSSVQDYLDKNLGLDVVRIAGKDRFDTAAQIADRLENYYGESTAYVVNGRNFPDALSIAPVAADQGAPILLVESNSIPTATANKLKNYEEKFVIGGKAVVSDSIVNNLKATRISGEDRYETSFEVAEYFFNTELDSHSAYIATSTNFADALTGSVSAAYMGAPLLLTPPTSLHSAVKTYSETHNTLWFTILGGPNAVSDKIEQELWTLVK
jgi:putative cell wall-binding protein